MSEKFADLVSQSVKPGKEAALSALDLQIQAHKESDKAESWLSRAVGAVTLQNSRCDSSLSELEALKARAQQELKSGDSVAFARTQEEIEEKVKADREALTLKHEIGHYGGGLLKTGSLFLRGRLGVAGTIGFYALDQMRCGDDWKANLADLTLGGIKGAGMKYVFHRFGDAQTSVAAKGVGFGLLNTGLDVALNRETFKDAQSGQLNVSQGLSTIARTAFDSRARAVDAVVFVGAHGLFEGANALAGGALKRSQFLSTSLMGTSFGLSGGAAGEYIRQKQAGEHFDAWAIAKRSLLQGAFDTVAAGSAHGLGSSHVRSYLTEPFLRTADTVNIMTGRGIPVARFIERSGDPASPTLKLLAEISAKIRVMPGEKATFVDHARGLIRLKKGADGADLGHELNHVASRADSISEHLFRRAATQLGQGEPGLAEQTYTAARLRQERLARLAEQAVAREKGDQARASRVVIDPLKILSELTPEGISYRETFRREFAEFRKSNGRLRPRVDYQGTGEEHAVLDQALLERAERLSEQAFDRLGAGGRASLAAALGRAFDSSEAPIKQDALAVADAIENSGDLSRLSDSQLVLLARVAEAADPALRAEVVEVLDGRLLEYADKIGDKTAGSDAGSAPLEADMENAFQGTAMAPKAEVLEKLSRLSLARSEAVALRGETDSAASVTEPAQKIDKGVEALPASEPEMSVGAPGNTADKTGISPAFSSEAGPAASDLLMNFPTAALVGKQPVGGRARGKGESVPWEEGFAVKIDNKGLGLPNLAEVYPFLMRGAKPKSHEAIKELKRRGVTVIIDLIEKPKLIDGKNPEAEWAYAEGIEYIHRPTSVGKFSEADLAWIAAKVAEVEAAGGKAYLHCARGIDRTGVLVAGLRMMRDGWDRARAIREMEHFGYSGEGESATGRLVDRLPRTKGEETREWQQRFPEMTVDQRELAVRYGLSDPASLARELDAARALTSDASITAQDLITVLRLERALAAEYGDFPAEMVAQVFSARGNRHPLESWARAFAGAIQAVEMDPYWEPLLSEAEKHMTERTAAGRLLAARAESDPRILRQLPEVMSEEQLAMLDGGRMSLIFNAVTEGRLAGEALSDTQAAKLARVIEERARRDLDKLPPEAKRSQVHEWLEFLRASFKANAELRNNASFALLLSLKPGDVEHLSTQELTDLARSVNKGRLRRLAHTEHKDVTLTLLSDARTPTHLRNLLIEELALKPSILDELTPAETGKIKKEIEEYLLRPEHADLEATLDAVPRIVDKAIAAAGKPNLDEITGEVPARFRDLAREAIESKLSELARPGLKESEVANLRDAIIAEIAGEAPLLQKPLPEAEKSVRSMVNKLVASPLSDTGIVTLLQALPAEKRASAVEAVQARARYLSVPALVKEFSELGNRLRDDKDLFIANARDKRGYPIEKIRALTFGDTSAGGALAYLFRKFSSIEVDVHVMRRTPQGDILIESADARYVMERGRPHRVVKNPDGTDKVEGGRFVVEKEPSDLGKLVLFDQDGQMPTFDLNVVKPELFQEFHRGPNLFDVLLAGAGDRSALMASLTPHLKAIRGSNGDIRLQTEAIKTALEGVTPEERSKLESQALLYAIQLATGPQQTPHTVSAFLLDRGPLFISGSEMVRQAQLLHKELVDTVGKGKVGSDGLPQRLRFVTNADNGGSGHLVSYLYRLANGLTGRQYDRYFTPVDGTTSGALSGRTLVYLDDYIYSGKQAVDRVAKIRGWLAPTGVAADVIAASLGAYQAGLKHAAANGTKVVTVQGFVDLRTDMHRFIRSKIAEKQQTIEKLSGERMYEGDTTYDRGIEKARLEIRQYEEILASMEAILGKAELASNGTAVGQDVDILSGLVPFYMVPNDNPNFFNDVFADTLRLRARANSHERLYGQNDRARSTLLASDAGQQVLREIVTQLRTSRPGEDLLSPEAMLDYVGSAQEFVLERLTGDNAPPSVNKRAQLLTEFLRSVSADPVAQKIQVVPDSLLDTTGRVAFLQLKDGRSLVTADILSEEGFVKFQSQGFQKKVYAVDDLAIEIHVSAKKLLELSDPVKGPDALAEIQASLYHQLYSLQQMRTRANELERSRAHRRKESARSIVNELTSKDKEAADAVAMDVEFQLKSRYGRGEGVLNSYEKAMVRSANRTALEWFNDLLLDPWRGLPVAPPAGDNGHVELPAVVQIASRTGVRAVRGLQLNGGSVYLTTVTGDLLPIEDGHSIVRAVRRQLEDNWDVTGFSRQSVYDLVARLRTSPSDRAAVIVRFLLNLPNNPGNGAQKGI